MSIIIAEGWKTYADKAETAFGWPLYSSVLTATAFADISGRRTMDLAGGKLAKTFTPKRRVAGHVIVDLTAGTVVASSILFQIGLNPANVQSTGYNTNTGDRLRLYVMGTDIYVVRQPFGVDGSLQTGTQSVARVTHGMTAGSSYRVEFLIDVTNETGTCEVMINGVSVINAEFSRTIGSHACDAAFGVLSVYAAASSGARGRFSNVILYDTDADTPWPVGPLNISYMPAAGRPGETFTFPPALTDSEPAISDTVGETWGFSGPPVTQSVKAIIGHLRMSSPDAVIPASAEITYSSGATVLAEETATVQPGATVFDRQVRIPNSAAASLADVQINVKLSE